MFKNNFTLVFVINFILLIKLRRSDSKKIGISLSIMVNSLLDISSIIKWINCENELDSTKLILLCDKSGNYGKKLNLKLLHDIIAVF